LARWEEIQNIKDVRWRLLLETLYGIYFELGKLREKIENLSAL